MIALSLMACSLATSTPVRATAVSGQLLTLTDERPSPATPRAASASVGAYTDAPQAGMRVFLPLLVVQRKPTLFSGASTPQTYA